MVSRTRSLTGDELAALADQRDFLLTSLEDLEEEHVAGDVDERDYTTLKEDYTRRAAQVLRAIEAHEARVPDDAARRRSWWRIAAAAGGTLLFAVGAGVLVAQTAGQREAGDTITGDIREPTAASRLAQAHWLLQQRNFDQAIAGYDDVLADEPDNVEALTFKGWALTRSGEAMAGVQMLEDAAELDPENASAHAFLAITFVEVGNQLPAEAEAESMYDLARDRLETVDELGAEDEMMGELLAPVRAQLDED
jgi:cytochrome c-type biogenesis protein CcmH/NrfG